MVAESEISNSKAILGAVFVQYLIYALIYIIDGFRYESLYGDGAKSSNESKEKNGKKTEQKKG